MRDEPAYAALVFRGESPAPRRRRCHVTTGLLPIAQPAEVRRAAVRLLDADRVAFAAVVLTSCAAAAAGLLAPWLVGKIVNEVQAGGGVAAVDRWGLFVVLAAARASSSSAMSPASWATASENEPRLACVSSSPTD